MFNLLLICLILPEQKAQKKLITGTKNSFKKTQPDKQKWNQSIKNQ
jgi:hypothetical protein